MSYWTDKLTKAQVQHLLDAGITSLDTLAESRKAQRQLDPTHEVCWDCLAIVQRLGLEATGKETE